MAKQMMSPEETGEFIKKAAKKQFGYKLDIGGKDDFLERCGSTKLATFLASCGSSPMVNEVANYLLGLHMPEVDLLIWNSMVYMSKGIDKIDGLFIETYKANIQRKKEFTKEAYDGCAYNRTKPFKTERLMIKPLSHPMEDEILVSLEEEDADIRKAVGDSLNMAFQGFMLFFGILSFDEKDLLGFIALSKNYSMNRFGFDTMANVEYFVLKKHRGHGYAAEALSSLTKKVFSNEVAMGEMSEEKLYCFTDLPFCYPIIKAYVDETNMASYKTCLKAGFKKEGKMLVARDGKKHFEYIMSVDEKAYAKLG